VAPVGRLTSLTVIASCIFAIAPVAAQAAGLPSDPDAGSPSGTVYELPLDSARRDAAPRPSQGREGRSQTGSRDGDASGDSPIRSENNFGSSADVPGVDGSGTADGSAGGGSSSGDADGGSSSSDEASAGAADRASAGGGAAASGVAGAAATNTEDGSGPSTALVVMLLALIVLVGVGLGTAAARARRHERS
jgi:cobalamin biosynthesis Mg chelatase CobN